MNKKINEHIMLYPCGTTLYVIHAWNKKLIKRVCKSYTIYDV